MFEIETKELKTSEELNRKIDIICRFACVKYEFIPGNIKSIKNTNIAYVKPHILKVKGNDYLILEECEDVFINSYNLPCTALTKGVLPIELSELSKDNSYGITLISLNEEFRKKMEPGSAPYIDRINSLKKLHDRGCKTWVSIESYPTPNIIEQNFEEILNSISFVDKIIFGRLHYNKLVSQYKDYKEYYNNLVNKVINFCEERNIEYHIKDKTITEIQNT